MEKKTDFRARVMNYAWALWNATRQAWSECMVKAWQLYRLSKQMGAGQVSFSYIKTDGTIRRAVGTLQGIPARDTQRKSKPNFKTFAYFDVEKNAFRCFRVENLVWSAV